MTARLVFATRLRDGFDDEVNRIAQVVGGCTKALKLVARDKKLVRLYIPLQPAGADEPKSMSGQRNQPLAAQSLPAYVDDQPNNLPRRCAD